jgi:DNA-binding NarL/FixJ family response regulator
MIKIILILQEDLGLPFALLQSQKDFNITGRGKSTYDALQLTKTMQPDIVIVDSRIDKLSGINLISQIKNNCPHTMIILLSVNDDTKHVSEALCEGISGYVLWNDKTNLPSAVRIANNGSCYISERIVSQAFSMLAELSRYRGIYRTVSAFLGEMSDQQIFFSLAEKRMIRFISEGKSNKEIAEHLNLTPGTVRNGVSTVMQKAGTRSRFQMAIFALKNGLLDP